jgi:dihydropyrimidine dehydrogenase (NAD+) subunit PreA
MWRGVEVFEQLVSGLKSFMDRKGYDRIDDFKGLALKHLTTVEELSIREPKHGTIDRELCDGCKICERVCQYDAVEIKDEKAEVASEKCDGCGLCIAWCPKNAIKLI